MISFPQPPFPQWGGGGAEGASKFRTNFRSGEEVTAECEVPARGAGELRDRIVLALKLVLVVRHKLQVTEVVEDKAVMRLAVRLSYSIGEMCERPYLHLQRVLEQ